MRILHTSDWHLGKTMNGIDLLEDQKYFLEQLMEQVQKAADEKKPYSAVIVAGDIYDRQLPPAEATEVLSSFLFKFSQRFPQVHIFMISGNHDSASRLSFAAEFFQQHNIHITTNTKKIAEPVVLDGAAFYQIPYLYPDSLKNPADENLYLKHQQELYDEACRLIREAHEKNHPELPSIINAHPFALGKLNFGSERSNVGDTEQIDVGAFKGFTYCAFGHIHGYHVCDKENRCFYSGAPLAYHVDDSKETFMLDVEISGREVPGVKKIPVKPLHPVAKLEGKIREFTENREKWGEFRDSYVFVILTDEIAIPDAAVRLKEIFPNLVNVQPKERTVSKNRNSLKERKMAMDSKDISKIFRQFVEDVELKKISEMTDEEQKLLDDEVKLIREIAAETGWGENL